MIDDDIRALRTALAGGPTPGPWESLPVWHGPHYVARVNNREVVPPDACELAHEIVDARYIAAASPDRIARLLDEVERLLADAERYRWIRQRPIQTLLQGETTLLGRLSTLDATIDAARKEEKK